MGPTELGLGQTVQGFGQTGQGFGETEQGLGQTGQGLGETVQGFGQTGQGLGQIDSKSVLYCTLFYTCIELTLSERCKTFHTSRAGFLLRTEH